MRIPALILAATLLSATAGSVCGRQDPEQVRDAVEEFLAVQTRGLPGEASYTVRSIDPNNNLAPCPALDVSMPAASRAWGRTTVQVRCRTDAAWSLYVPVQIRVAGEYLVAARPLSQGQIIAEQDLLRQSGDLAELPPGILTDPQQAIGRVVAIGIAANRPLRGDTLRQPLAVRQGQSVKLVMRGTGFLATTEGRALNGAAEGQVAQARVAGGQTMSGIARSGGIIDISP